MAREGDCAEPRVTAAISQLRCWGAERRARRGSWGAGRVVCIPFLVACVGRPCLVVLVRRCLFWSRAAEKSTGTLWGELLYAGAEQVQARCRSSECTTRAASPMQHLWGDTTESPRVICVRVGGTGEKRGRAGRLLEKGAVEPVRGTARVIVMMVVRVGGSREKNGRAITATAIPAAAVTVTATAARLAAEPAAVGSRPESQQRGPRGEIARDWSFTCG